MYTVNSGSRIFVSFPSIFRFRYDSQVRIKLLREA